ncbi:MAG: alpha/beta hydrolase [Myxococcales bacterium]|nr:alpha/beta hydrolase [Myxococcales bacterium]
MKVHQKGSGRPLLLIHGSAADHTTWTVQFAGLREDFCMLAYDRNPAPRYTVQEHADDAAEILRSEVHGTAAVVGSSFGAIVALDLGRRYPELVSHLILCEPPLAQSDYLSPVPDGFACRFDDISARDGGPAASEFFLRCVLGDDAFERMPKAYRKRSMAAHEQIRADMGALASYRVRYDALASELRAKVYLLGGERSASFYADTLEALQFAIPGSERKTLRGAGHMMQVDAHRQFAEALRAL